MNSFFKPALKYIFIVTVTMGMGYSVWLLPHDKKDKKIKEGREKPITSPIDARDEASRYLQLASEDFFYHEFDKAIENYGKAITTFEKNNQLKKAAKVYESIGDLYKFRRNIKQAESQYYLAIEYHHRIKNPQGEARAMNHAGDLLMEQGDTTSAGTWYKKGVELVKEEAPNKNQALLYENMGRFYWKTEKNIPEAIVWYTRARDTFSALENQMGYDHMSAVLNKLRGGQNLNTH
jgi:tetratricopeptide (TPR) repeat protein